MSLIADVREIIEPWSPYRHDDAEIHAALFDAREKWENIRRGISATLRLTPKQEQEREPICDEWIVWDAALLVYPPDAYRGPEVYVRAEYLDTFTPAQLAARRARRGYSTPSPAKSAVKNVGAEGKQSQ